MKKKNTVTSKNSTATQEAKTWIQFKDTCTRLTKPKN